MVAVFDGTVCIKIDGRADFTSSFEFIKKLMGELWQRHYNHFMFDLRDCLTMDSTFLGVLSGIGLKFSGGKSVQVGAPLEVIQSQSPNQLKHLKTLAWWIWLAIKTCLEAIDPALV